LEFIMAAKIELPKSLEGKTALIAGAAGFVPSHVCELYLSLGARVIGLDNFITGSKSNIELLSKHNKFEFHQIDVSRELPNLSGQKIDYVFSLASPASPIDFKTIPLEIMKVNSEGTWRLLELAKEKNARFLEASTSETYGDPEIHPQVETYHGCVNPIGPRAPYDESKRFAEAMTMMYHRRYGVDTRIVRIFNTYGPRMRPDDGRVIPNFINQALEGKDITVYGDGSQTRSYCFVDDLVEGIHTVMHSSEHTPFNVGNPDEYTIKETAELIIKILNSKSKIAHFPLPEDDPKRRCPNIDKLQAVSNYKPQVSFEDGIRRTAEFFKSLWNK
jgi:nucleoside-diphosphate-sugar epimerase